MHRKTFLPKILFICRNSKPDKEKEMKVSLNNRVIVVLFKDNG